MAKAHRKNAKSQLALALAPGVAAAKRAWTNKVPSATARRWSNGPSRPISLEAWRCSDDCRDEGYGRTRNRQIVSFRASSRRRAGGTRAPSGKTTGGKSRKVVDWFHPVPLSHDVLLNMFSTKPNPRMSLRWALPAKTGWYRCPVIRLTSAAISRVWRSGLPV
jgi:hypothetical protein